MEAQMIESSSVKLNPVTSLNASRYDGNSAHIELYPRIINRGPPSRSSTSSLTRWHRYIHPQGQPYFIQDTEFNVTVVTQEYVDDAQIAGRILDCIKAVHNELLCNSISLPSRCELFLELGDNHTYCNYYFVDHDEKALFWLEDICAESLGIPAAVSSTHLETALQRLYWVHVEFFPMHHESHEQEFSTIIEKLYNIISHGQADRLTSRTSTFPYTTDTCTHFLRLLGEKRGQRVDGYTLCYAARLASAIMNQRFLTFYGQQSAQLDRLQEVWPSDPVQEHNWLHATSYWLMWGTPQHYNNLLEDLYVNELVYADQWTDFISLCLADWTSNISWSFPVFIASILLTNVRGAVLFMSILSGLSCAVSIASAYYFYFTHQPLVNSTPNAGVRYLRSARSSTARFIPLSIILGLPRASCLWGVTFVVAQFFFIVSYCAGRFIALVTAATFVAILILVIYIHRPSEVSMDFHRLSEILMDPASSRRQHSRSCGSSYL